MSVTHRPRRRSLLMLVRVPVLAWCLLTSAELWAADRAGLSIQNGQSHDPNSRCFALATDQIVEWEANFLANPNIPGSNPGLNKFVVSSGDSATTCQSVLNPGINRGECQLNKATYCITDLLGDGTYSVFYNRVAKLGLEPAAIDFGRVTAGEMPDRMVRIQVQGDAHDVPMTLAVTSDDPARFEVVSPPSGVAQPPSSRTFRVRFRAGTEVRRHQATLSIKGSSDAGSAEARLSVAGETRIPKPNVACSAVQDLGEADWATGETPEFVATFRNDGDAPLRQTGEVGLTSDLPGIFSWPTGSPTWSQLAGGRPRSLSIRFAPTAEQTYKGHLLLRSNDPDEPEKICSFRARGHHPVPRAEFRETTLDFGEVQLGFRFTRTLRITNSGDADLTLKTAVAGAGEEADPWPELPLGQRTIEPGEAADLDATFHPIRLGARRIVLAITTNEEPSRTLKVPLTATGVFPTPIDSVLLLDRSGSMGQLSAFGGTKIQALSRAASLYTDLLRSEIPSADVGDRLGLVRFDDTWDTYLDLDRLEEGSAGGHRQEAHALLADTEGGLRPDGGTALGGALEHGASLLNPKDDQRSRVVIAFTDGRETVVPWIADVLDGVLARTPDVTIYSLGLGADTDINADLLQEAAEASGGVFYHPPDLAEENLRRAYFDIFRRARRLQLAEDTFNLLQFGDGGPIEVGRVTLLTSDRSADFLVLQPNFRLLFPWMDRLLLRLHVELIDPRGRLITPQTALTDASVKFIEGEDFTLYRLDFPNADEHSFHTGTWKVQVRATSPTGGVPVGFNVPFGTGLAVAPGSEFRLDSAVLPAGPLAGAEVTLRAVMTDRGRPAPDGNVSVEVRSPRDRDFTVALRDDGTGGDETAGDAVWTGRFLDTGEEGTYRFTFEAIGKNFRGETGRRLATRHLYLGRPTGRPSDVDDPTGRRLFGSLHAGIAAPTRGFSSDDADAKDGRYFAIDLSYRLTEVLSLRGILGRFHLPEADEPDWSHFSLDLHGALPFGERRWRPYFQTGLGLYRPEGSSTTAGVNIGAGFEWAIDPPFLFTFGFDWHYVGSSPQRDVAVVHLGFVF